MEEKDVIASEAVFGFAAWLTTRKKPVLLGAEHDAAPAAELADQWCRANNLPEPREGAYPENITHPPSERKMTGMRQRKPLVGPLCTNCGARLRRRRRWRKWDRARCPSCQVLYECISVSPLRFGFRA